MSELITRLQQIIPDDHMAGRLWVGLSGGLDSVVLLHALLASGVAAGKITALHVHHGLSVNADQWLDFCQRLCDGAGVALISEKVTLQSWADGLEQAARAERYEAFCRHLRSGDVLLLAHHGNDQLETFFQRLFRGAGMHGLAAIAPHRLLAPGVKLLRPWLNVPRQVLETYAAENQLQWVEDESNQDLSLERNWWRHDILPQIFSRYPGKEKSLLRSVSQLRQDQQVLAGLIAPLTEQCLLPVSWPGTAALACDTDLLQQQKEELRPYILRDWLARLGLEVPSAAWLQTLQQEVISAASDRQPLLVLGDKCVRRFRHCLYVVFSAEKEHQQVSELLVGETGQQQVWSGGVIRVQSAAADGGLKSGRYHLLAASRCRGVSLRAAGRPAKNLKALFQEHGVPVWLRDDWPVLLQNGVAAALPGLIITEEFHTLGDYAFSLNWESSSLN